MQASGIGPWISVGTRFRDMVLSMSSHQQITLHRDDLEDYITTLESFTKGALSNLLHRLQPHVLAQKLIHAGQNLSIGLHGHVGIVSQVTSDRTINTTLFSTNIASHLLYRGFTPFQL